MRPESQKAVHCHRGRSRIAEQPLALKDQQLRSREVPYPPAKLLEIEPATGVRVAMVIEAVVVGVALEALLLPGQPLGLFIDRLGKGKRFAFPQEFVLVVRQGPFDRIPKQGDELGLRQQLRGPLRRERVRQVVGRGLECHRTAAQLTAIWETSAVPF